MFKLNKKLILISFVLVLALFVISACQDGAVGRRVIPNQVEDKETIIKILSINERVQIPPSGGGGYVKLRDVVGIVEEENGPPIMVCDLIVRYPKIGGESVVSLETGGDLKVFTEPNGNGELTIGVTNLRQSPDRCAIVFSYPAEIPPMEEP